MSGLFVDIAFGLGVAAGLTTAVVLIAAVGALRGRRLRRETPP